MDNRVFNVNGVGEEMLLLAMQLAFKQGGVLNTASAWVHTNEHGLILCWMGGDGLNQLPGAMSADECLPLVRAWLKSDHAKAVELSEWCNDQEHDGHNADGWQVYVGEWGKVGPAGHKTICAIKPAFAWHGK